ncbi:MAG: hypothetical protein KKD07_08905, partial [Candidatus Omnitrophica bacterium]|nr:hypothetical protein [Candidatus Omnitrophota bacterium]
SALSKSLLLLKVRKNRFASLWSSLTRCINGYDKIMLPISEGLMKSILCGFVAVFLSVLKRFKKKLMTERIKQVGIPAQ